MQSSYFHQGHLIDEHQYTCLCCQEIVGKEDSITIEKQLSSREKNCMWCGDDFDLSEEKILQILDDEGIIDELNETASRLNRASQQILLNGDIHKIVLDLEVEGGMVMSIQPHDFEKERKKAIMIHFGIDVDKEKFDPRYADKNGKPRDRIEDAIPYEEMRRDELPHKILQFVKKNPDCTGSDIKKRVRFSRTSRIRNLPNHPISRLYGSKLIDCTSKFLGLADMSAVASRMPSGYFGKVPRYSRKYTITAHGIGVLKELASKRKEVLL